MTLPGWNNANNFLMRSDSSKVDEDLTDFPVLITLNSGTGITGYDTTAIFDELRDDSYYTLSSDTLTSGTISLLLHCDGDQSDSKHTITFNNEPKIYTSEGPFSATCTTSGSYYFDGSNDYISIPDDDSSFAFGGNDFTIDFWIKRNRDTIFERVFGQYRAAEGASHNPIMFSIGADDLLTFAYAYNTSNDKDSVESVTVIDDTDWHHIAVVKRNNNTSLRLFIDGTLDATNSSATNSQIATASDFSIGRLGEYGSNYFQGYIAEFRISKEVPRWISNFTPPTEPHTKDPQTKLLLQPSGDLSTSKHTLTFNGTDNYASQGMFDGSYYFNGSDDYISVPENDAWHFGTGDFTIDFFVLFSTANAQNTKVLGRWNYGSDKRVWNFDIETGNTMSFQMSTDGNLVTIDLIGTTDLNDGAWHHIAVSRYGSNFYLFVDGVIEDSDTSILVIFNSDVPITIATNYTASGQFFSGYLDEIRIVKGEALYTSDFTPRAWPYEEYNSKYDEYTKLLLHADGDDSGNNHTINFNGGVNTYSSFGPLNGSYYFDGTDGYISIADSDDFYLPGDFTIECFFNTVSASDNMLYAQRVSSGTGVVLKLDSNGNVEAFLGNGSWTIAMVSSGQVYNDGLWHHAAFVRSGNLWLLFADGVLKDSDTNSITPNNWSENVNIGSATSGGGWFHEGYVSEIRISKGIARWTTGFTPPTEPYTTDSGTVLLLHPDGDESVNQHTLTFNNEPKNYSSVGKFNGSYYFDGVSDYIRLSDSTDFDFGTGDFTVDFYLKSTQSTATNNWLVDNWNITGDNRSWGFVINTGYIRFYWSLDGTAWDYIVSDSSVADYGWHHCAAVRVGTALYLFINGILQIDTDTISAALHNNNVLCIGANATAAPTQYYEGYLSEIRISKGIARWTSNFTPPQSPYGSSSWFNRKKIAVTATDNVEKHDLFTKLLLSCEGDKSSSQHTLTFNNQPKLYTGQDTPSGYAYYFDGTDDYITIPDSDDWYFGSEDFTIDFWINTTTTVLGYIILQWTAPYVAWMVAVLGDGRINFGTGNGGSWSVNFSSINSYNDGEHHHVVLVRKVDGWYIYVDGVMEAKTTNSFSIPNLSIPLEIGAFNSGSSPYSGYLSEMRVSNVVRFDAGNNYSVVIPYDLGEWDEKVYPGPVIKDGSIYKMWYAASLAGQYAIGYATSPDGINWTKYASNPVFEKGVASSWDESRVTFPSVIKEDSTYKMWYEGSNSADVRQIGYATSTDGINWTRYVSNPVVTPSQSWCNLDVSNPSVIKDGSTYKMWFGGAYSGDVDRIGYATSSDGTSWSMYGGNPVVPVGGGGAWDDRHIHWPFVIKEDSTYKMWYGGYDGTGITGYKIGYAESSDGITWSKDSNNPMFGGEAGTLCSQYAYGQSVLRDGESFQMWFGGSDGTYNQVGYFSLEFPVPTEPYTTDSGTVLLLHPDGDESLSQHTLTFNNGTKNYSTVGPFETTYSGSYYFDGTDDYISIPDSDDFDFGVEDFTIDFWFNVPDITPPSVASCPITKYHNTTTANRAFMVYIWDSEINFHAVQEYGVTDIYLNSGAYIYDNTWHHLAVSNDGTTYRLFVDGILRDSAPALSYVASSPENIFIAARNDTAVSNFYEGYLAEIRISKGIARWTSDFTPPTAPYSKQSGEVEVPVEIEAWDDENEEAFLWAKIPSIVSGTETEIYLHYDLERDDNPYIGDTIDLVTQNVWDENFVGVWHMAQSPIGTDSVLDSTINKYHGTPGGSMTSYDLVTSGTGKAINFDGSDDYILTGLPLSEIASGPVTITLDIITKDKDGPTCNKWLQFWTWLCSTVGCLYWQRPWY